MRFFKLFLFTTLLFSYNSANAAQKRDILVVSLGSHCQASRVVSTLGLRAYPGPLDMLLSVDHEGVVRLIDDKFQYMMDKNYLILNSPDCVVNTLYNLDFRHDWSSYDLLGLLPSVAAFYNKRIQGFFDLPEIGLC